jgi:hypothetical protein
MSEFDARLDRDASILKRAQSINANPTFILDFTVCVAFLVVGVLTLVASSMRGNEAAGAEALETHAYPWVGWAVLVAIVVGTLIVQRVPSGENMPIGVAVLCSLLVGGIAVYVAALPGAVTLAVVLLGAVLVLATPNGGNFMLMGMAVLSLGAGLVTLWAAALAIFGAE